MYIYVSINTTGRSKNTRISRDKFINGLVKDGFSKLYPYMFVRYCTSLYNAVSHKEKIQSQIIPKLRVSIILVADQQADLSFHYNSSSNVSKIPNKLEMIEFI